MLQSTKAQRENTRHCFSSFARNALEGAQANPLRTKHFFANEAFAFTENRKGIIIVLLTIFITVLLVALDQFTKYLATAYLAPVGTLPFLPGVMELRYVLNDGAAFSILSGGRWLLIVVTGVALAGIAWYLLARKPQGKMETVSFVLILAGGIGNFIDRVLNGTVVDFFAVTFTNFAVFNVADCFVCVGVALLLIYYVAQEVQRAREKKGKPHDEA